MNNQVDVVVVGSEPAALACCLQLLQTGATVGHVFPEPFGLIGSTRDIGLAYPELGEPWPRIEDSLGQEIALEYHLWGKRGVERLQEMAPQSTTRGARLVLTRSEIESKWLSEDALARQAFGDESRLMSGAAASNYAPLSSTELVSLETHALAFAPVTVTAELILALQSYPNYTHRGLDAETEWPKCRVRSDFGGGVKWSDGAEDVLNGAVTVVAAAMDTVKILGKFKKVLTPMLGQAFRSAPLRETCRTNVVGLTSSWGYERYRFDSENRLLACGIDPNQDFSSDTAVVNESVQQRFQERSCQFFTDLHLSQDFLRWAAVYANTCDGLPILGPLSGDPSVHVACGFSTSAWSRGVTAGIEIAKALNSNSSLSPLLERCSPRRFG